MANKRNISKQNLNNMSIKDLRRLDRQLSSRIRRPKGTRPLGERSTTTVPIQYDSNQSIQGFQFDIEGVTVTGAFGGEAATIPMMVYVSGNFIMGFSFTGQSIPPGSGILTNLLVVEDDVSNACVVDNVDLVFIDETINQYVPTIENCLELVYTGTDVPIGYFSLRPAQGPEVYYHDILWNCADLHLPPPESIYFYNWWGDIFNTPTQPSDILMSGWNYQYEATLYTISDYSGLVCATVFPDECAQGGDGSSCFDSDGENNAVWTCPEEDRCSALPLPPVYDGIINIWGDLSWVGFPMAGGDCDDSCPTWDPQFHDAPWSDNEPWWQDCDTHTGTCCQMWEEDKPAYKCIKGGGPGAIALPGVKPLLPCPPHIDCPEGQMWRESTCSCEIPGCTFPTACNYNPDATLNNWICLFPECPVFTGDITCECNCEGDQWDECGECNGDGPSIECWDGSFVCNESDCSEEVVPEAILSLSGLNEENGTFEVRLSNTEDVYGFQLNLSNITITDVYGGRAAENGFLLSFAETTSSILGVSFEGNIVPVGSGVLFYVSYSNISGAVCINDPIVGGETNLEDPAEMNLDTIVEGGCIKIKTSPSLPPCPPHLDCPSGQMWDENTCSCVSVFAIEVDGCTNNTACNYNPDATRDDGSCWYPECLVFTDPGCGPGSDCDCNESEWDDCGVCGGQCFPTTDFVESCFQCWDGSLVCNETDCPSPPMDGCTDEEACNSNPDATQDDGSCWYAIAPCTCIDGEGAVDSDGDGICDTIDDCIGIVDQCGVCNGPGAIYECGCYDVDIECWDGSFVCNGSDCPNEPPNEAIELIYCGDFACGDTPGNIGWTENDLMVHEIENNKLKLRNDYYGYTYYGTGITTGCEYEFKFQVLDHITLSEGRTISLANDLISIHECGYPCDSDYDIFRGMHFDSNSNQHLYSNEFNDGTLYFMKGYYPNDIDESIQSITFTPTDSTIFVTVAYHRHFNTLGTTFYVDNFSLRKVNPSCG